MHDLVSSGEAITADLICLRPGSSATDDYEELFTDPAVGCWIRPEPMSPFTRSDIERMARRDRAHWDEHGYGPWLVRERDPPGAFVGRGGLAWATVGGNREVELPWAVIPSKQKKGYATAMAIAAIGAAREAGIGRVVSLTLPDNVASRRVMEKAGLRYVAEVEHVGLPHVLYSLSL